MTASWHLATARLRLSPCTLADLEALHALWTDPDVRRYLWDDEQIARAVTASVIQSSMASFAATGFGQWAVRASGHDAVIGFSGLRPAKDSAETELLYGLAPTYWGKGLATEAAGAVLAYAFEVLGLERVVASTDTPNVASIRVLQRLGMRFQHAGCVAGRPTVHYTLMRAAFQARRG